MCLKLPLFTPGDEQEAAEEAVAYADGDEEELSSLAAFAQALGREVKRQRREAGNDELLEKMVSATSAGEEGEASEGDMRKLLSLLREGKSEARCSFSEAGSCMSSNRVEVDLEGFFHVGGTRYEISGGVSNEEGDVTLSGMTTVGGIGYFCEDDWMKGKSECVSDSHASQWAEQAGVQMTESQVLRGVVSALEVLLGETQVGDAKDSNYGVDPVQQILEWVGEAVA